MITAMTAPLNHYLPGSIMINLTNKYITLQFFFPKEFKLTRDSGGHDISHTLTGVSKWAGTQYFYPPEIVYSTGRNY